jgi:hypothetical protein
VSNPASANIMMPIQQFEGELRRVARLVPKATVENPLAAIVQKIVQNPAYNESRLLTRLLTALTYQRGEFRFAEAAVFDTATLALIVGLLDTLSAGSVTDSQCRLAVEAADAAQLSVGG